MYLHLGRDVMVAHSRIVAILDRQVIDRSAETRQYFNRIRGAGQVFGDLNDAKSLIVLNDAIICSPISAVTLMRRIASTPAM